MFQKHDSSRMLHYYRCVQSSNMHKNKFHASFSTRLLVDFIDVCRFLSILGFPKWCRHRMTPTKTTTSQQGPCPTATGKQTRTGIKYPVQGKPLTLIYIYIYIHNTQLQPTRVRGISCFRDLDLGKLFQSIFRHCNFDAF